MRTEMRSFVLSGVLACLLLFACSVEDEPIQEPVPLPDPTPIAYPEGLWDRGVTGETEVLIHVNEVGDVDSARVSKSSGYSDFDSAAVNGVRRIRFTPARRGDRRVDMWARVPIRFEQDSTATLGPVRESGNNDE